MEHANARAPMRRSQELFIRIQIIALAALFAAALAPLPAQAWTYKVIHDFCSKRACEDGYSSQAGLVLDAAGNLYGTTVGGGNNGSRGVVFELVPSAVHMDWKSKTLHDFAGYPTDGAEPMTPVIIDTAGSLYGTTFAGGQNNGGMVYQLPPNGDRVKRISRDVYDLVGNAAGDLAYQGKISGLPYDGASPLYGTSGSTVFSVVRSGKSWIGSTIYNLNWFIGGGLLVDPRGDLLVGMSYGGGGSLVELVEGAGTWSATTLYNFCSVTPNCADGALPVGNLAMDGNGVVYGGTDYGGTQRRGCCGVLYKFGPVGRHAEYTPFYDFCARKNCKDGATPWTDPALDSAGNVYGTTVTGGGNMIDRYHLGGGTVFRLVGSALETLHAFCAEADCVDGEYPYGGVVMDSSGNLFGTTSAGGKYSAGVVYEISP